VTLVQAMQPRPPVIPPDATLSSAAKQMASNRMALLPVVLRGRMVGTLSAFDLIEICIAERQRPNQQPDQRKVSAAMRPDPPSCRPEDTVAHVREQMHALRMPTLPVTEANGELVGLVDLFDLEVAEDAGVAAGPEPEMVERVRGEAF